MYLETVRALLDATDEKPAFLQNRRNLRFT